MIYYILSERRFNNKYLGKDYDRTYPKVSINIVKHYIYSFSVRIGISDYRFENKIIKKVNVVFAW